MADTKRTLSDLLTNLFQDGQASGAITPQDMRDLIESVRTQWAGLYVSTPASTTISGAGTFVKGAGTTTLYTAGGTAAVDFDMPSDNRLRYTGTPTKDIMVICNASIEINTAVIDKELGLELHDNAGVLTGTRVVGFSPATTVNSVQLSTMGVFNAATNDYVEAFIGNIDSTDDITLRNMNMYAWTIPS
jgi:hypothetical protein